MLVSLFGISILKKYRCEWKREIEFENIILLIINIYVLLNKILYSFAYTACINVSKAKLARCIRMLKTNRNIQINYVCLQFIIHSICIEIKMNIAYEYSFFASL